LCYFLSEEKTSPVLAAKQNEKLRLKLSKSQLYEQDSVNMPKLAFGVPMPRAEGGSVERQKLL